MNEPNPILEKLKWSDSYSTGFAQIDLAHKEILRSIKDFIHHRQPKQLPSSQTDHKALKRIILMFKLHLELEDNIGTQSSSLRITKEHDEHHKSFVVKITEYEKALSKGDVVPTHTFIRVLAEDFVQHLQFEASLFRSSDD